MKTKSFAGKIARVIFVTSFVLASASLQAKPHAASSASNHAAAAHSAANQNKKKAQQSAAARAAAQQNHNNYEQQQKKHQLALKEHKAGPQSHSVWGDTLSFFGLK